MNQSVRSVAYYRRVSQAAQQLSGMTRGSAPSVRQLRNRTLGDCGCNAPKIDAYVPGSHRLHGYKVVKIGSYRVVRAVRTGLSGVGMTAKPVIAMLPVSDRKAVHAAVLMFAKQDIARRTQGRLNGLGDAQASGAVTGAATGAKVGSIIPVVGTVIGAAIGAVAGWVMSRAKPVRASAAQIGECRQTLVEYMSIAAQSPNAPLPMDWPQILDLNWCFQAVYGAETGSKDPRFFNGGFENLMRPLALEVVKKIYETPVGGTVNLDALNTKDIKGKPMRFTGMSFVNPTFTDLKNVATNVMTPIDIQTCKENTGKYQGGCDSKHGRVEMRRLMYDLLGWAARTTLPNISEEDLKAASQVAATIPNTSAKDVVSAVESIIKRPVTQGETAALLTPSAAVPGAAPVPIIPTSAIAPLIPQVQANPIDTATGQPQSQIAPLDPFTGLPTTGSGSGNTLAPVSPSTQTPLTPATAGVSSTNPWILGGLAAAAIIFATARPAARRTSRGRK